MIDSSWIRCRAGFLLGISVLTVVIIAALAGAFSQEFSGALTALIIKANGLLEVRDSHASANDFWLAISPYDPDESVQLSTDVRDQDVPFCFEATGNGETHVSANCERLHHLRPMMRICGWQNLENGAWNPQVIDTDSEKLARNIISLSRKFGCKVLLIDFENITGQLTTHFTPKIVNLIRELKKMDEESTEIDQSTQNAKSFSKKSKGRTSLQISVAVYAKTHEPGEWDGPAGQDWKKICNVADEIVIMAYEHSVPGRGVAGETAPMSWVRQVLELARGSCGVQQIRLGLAAFGYDWQTGKVITERDYRTKKLGRPLKFSPATFVETAQERRLKVELANSFGIYKFLVWSKGQMLRPSGVVDNEDDF